MALLETKNLSKSFGGLKAVSNLNFELEEGEVRGVIGPNGSGKSTFFNLMTLGFSSTYQIYMMVSPTGFFASGLCLSYGKSDP